MTQTGYSNAIVDAMLSWLKGLATWVLRLFNLSGGASPLRFLANNWLKLLIVLLVVGVVTDLLVWLIRWRPHWVWFGKKRVIINDRDFFKREDPAAPAVPRAEGTRPSRIARPKRDWEESEYLVPGEERRKREAAERRARREAARAAAAAGTGDVFTDGRFNVNAKQKFSDKYEDEVFSVSNLPAPERAEAERAAKRPQRSRSAAPRGERRGKSRASMARGEKRAPASRKRSARR